MATPAATAHPGAHRDHGFHAVRIGRVVEETADAGSFVLDVPAELAEDFAYEAGQFCTFRIWIDGQPHLRCYSMSSTPGVDAELQVTVKRVPGGLVSNWMLDHLHAGDEVDVTLPGRGVPAHRPRRRGRRLRRRQRHHAGDLASSRRRWPRTDRVGAAALRQPRRRRDDLPRRARRAGARAPRSLPARAPPRRRRRLPRRRAVRALRRRLATAPTSTCAGPGPFMDLVEATLLDEGVAPDQIHIERFTPAEPVVDEPARGGTTVRCADDGHDRARRPHRHRRAPRRHHDPADGSADGDVAAVLVRVGELRHVHGPAAGGHRAR